MNDKEEKPKEEVKEPVFTLVEVPTQTTPAIQTPEGEIISEGQGIVMILNEISAIRKLVG